MNLEDFYVYDIETFKYAFTFSVVRADGKHRKVFEVSKFNNELSSVYKCLDYIEENQSKMIGFNNLAFDYPIIHEVMKTRNSLLKLNGSEVALKIWKLAQIQIDSFKNNQFGNTVKSSDVRIPQIDLYKIWHFDNKAKSTSLKMLEFNMRMNNIEDLPYGIEEELSEEQIQKLKDYNEHDTEATRQFALKSESAIDFRKVLSEKYGIDFTNANDTKIGKEYFIQRLEQHSPGTCYSFDSKGKRHIRQTKRPIIKLKDCLFDYYDFTRPEFVAVMEWFRVQKITETKGVFSDIDESKLGELAKYSELVIKRKKFKNEPTEKDLRDFKHEHPMGWVEEQELKGTSTVIVDGVKTKIHKKSYWMCWKEADTLNVVIDGFRFDFGTGGIHGSIQNKVARENKNWRIKDWDVESFYGNLAISNKFYPNHMGELFCDIYKDVFTQRKSFKKGTPENAVMKLALNGTYGETNNKFSCFYDPQYTMTTTVGGQLTLCLLVDMWYRANVRFKMIMANTDGVTVAVHVDDYDLHNQIAAEWENKVKLKLEAVDYSAMYLRDVNSYIGVYRDDPTKVKRKGAYQYQDLGWHQNQGGLVIPMAAEAAMLHGIDPREFILNHAKNPDNKFDFCLRTKVPRSSKLMLVYEDGRQEQQQNICRYYPCKTGGKLVKLMPALEGKEADGERELSIDASWNVKTCNNIDNFSFDDVDYDYYVAEAEKLVIKE